MGKWDIQVGYIKHRCGSDMICLVKLRDSTSYVVEEIFPLVCFECPATEDEMEKAIETLELHVKDKRTFDTIIEGLRWIEKAKKGELLPLRG
jgi:hypothetical protein